MRYYFAQMTSQEDSRIVSECLIDIVNNVEKHVTMNKFLTSLSDRVDYVIEKRRLDQNILNDNFDKISGNFDNQIAFLNKLADTIFKLDERVKSLEESLKRKRDEPPMKLDQNKKCKYIDYINKGAKKITTPWKPGMAKYRYIFYNSKSKKWWLNFCKNYSSKNSKKEIEKDLEDILTKLKIPFSIAIRSGYSEKDDKDGIDNIDDTDTVIDDDDEFDDKIVEEEAYDETEE